MGSAAPKKRPMRSKKSGVKKIELVKSNLTILKKLAVLLIIVVFASCVPVRYVDVYSHYNYYQKHRFQTYTVPVLIPGRGIMLQTLPAPRQYRQLRRSKH